MVLELYLDIHSVPDIWSSDIWSFRLYGQFLAGPERNRLSIFHTIQNFRFKVIYGRKFRIYGLFLPILCILYLIYS